MHLFKILVGEEFEVLALDKLSEYRDALRAVAEKVYAKDAETIGELSPSDLLEQMREGVQAIELANARIAELEKAAEPEPTEEELAAELETLATQAGVNEPEAPAEELAAETTEPETAPEPEAAAAEETEPLAAGAEEPTPEPEPEPEAAETVEPEEAVVAAAEKPKSKPLSRPSRSRASKPEARPEVKRPALTAACEGLGIAIGEDIGDENALAAAMISKRSRFGNMTSREDVPIAHLDWSDDYPEDRRLSPRDGVETNTAKLMGLLASIQSDPKRGTDQALIASGGICAPVTPYYDLQVISVDDRPVRAALPAFLADRGGIQFGRPPTIADVDEAVGIITAAEDALGGTSATKTCQVLVCPDFEEVDVDIIYHCVQTSNLTYRTFPEQLAQFNRLVMAEFARVAEGKLLDGIRAASTHVTAATRGWGASSDLLGQILAAANGMRSRNRMNTEAVLRLMIPDWAIDLMISDVIRGQFQRFDTDEAKLTALLRSFDVEPSFYMDTATGRSQVFGAQAAAALDPFPSTVEWYLYPEGSFLYLDGGTLELGLVRDSVLNSTNEFQIFGESFENIAFLGVESIAVTSTVCDSGAVSLPIAQTDCNYA